MSNAITVDLGNGLQMTASEDGIQYDLNDQTVSFKHDGERGFVFLNSEPVACVDIIDELVHVQLPGGVVEIFQNTENGFNQWVRKFLS